MPASSCGSCPTRSQCSSGYIKLLEKTSDWRKPPVALADDRQRLRSETAEFEQEREYLRGYVVQVVVEQTTSPVWHVDPAAATQMHSGDPSERHSAKERMRIVAEIDRVGIKIMKIEQQLHAGPADDPLDPLWFVQSAPRRCDQSGDIFDLRRTADDSRRAFEVSAGAFDRSFIARRRRKMTDFDTAAADEGQVLGPALGASGFD